MGKTTSSPSLRRLQFSEIHSCSVMALNYEVIPWFQLALQVWGKHVAMKGLIKKGRGCTSKFVPSYLVISYTLAFSGFFSVRRLSYEKPAWNICVRIFLRGCWGDAFVLYSLHLNKLFNTNVFNIICCYCWAPVSPQGQQAPKWQHHPFMYSMVSRKRNPSKEVGKERDSNLANSHQKVLWKVNTGKAVLVLLHDFSFPWDKMCLAWFLRAAIRRGHRQMYVDRHNSLCIYNSP